MVATVDNGKVIEGAVNALNFLIKRSASICAKVLVNIGLRLLGRVNIMHFRAFILFLSLFGAFDAVHRSSSAVEGGERNGKCMACELGTWGSRLVWSCSGTSVASRPLESSRSGERGGCISQRGTTLAPNLLEGLVQNDSLVALCNTAPIAFYFLSSGIAPSRPVQAQNITYINM